MGVKIIPRGRLRVSKYLADEPALLFDHYWEVQRFYGYRSTLASGVTCSAFLANAGRYSCGTQRQTGYDRILLTDTASGVDFNDRNYRVLSAGTIITIAKSFVSGTNWSDNSTARWVYNPIISNPTDKDAATLMFTRSASNYIGWNIYQYG